MLSLLLAFAPGITLEFGDPCWYRDNVGVCGTTFNTTNGYSLTWEA